MMVRALHADRQEIQMTYTPLRRIAQRLGTDEDTLRRFHQLGWISIVEKSGTEYLASQQEYKAKFILYLQQQRGLDSRDITRVLSEQDPPYSAANVDLVLSAGRTAKRVH
jgi:hypothetical protein